RTAFVTTDGFRDNLDMRGYRRPNIYDPDWERLPPIVPGSLTWTVPGRILSSGEVEQELRPEAVVEALRPIVDADVEAVAVCLMSSYINGAHEQVVREALEELLPGVPVCLSSEINPEIGEF